MKKVLILAYDFPPYVSVGGLRPYSWYKHFKEFGLYPIVVTRQWGNKYGNHLDYIAPGKSEKTIIVENDAGTIICTPYKSNWANKIFLKYGNEKYSLLRKAITAWFEFVQFVIPIGPKSGLYFGAREFLKSNSVDCIIATGDPFVLFDYAAKLSAKFKIPWIADYRDIWTNDLPMAKKPILRLWTMRFEKRLIQKADSITMVSDFVRHKTESLLKKKQVEIIENGFDDDVISSKIINKKQNSDILTFAYAGSIFKWHPLERFLSSLVEFKSNCSDSKFVVKFYGTNINDELRELVDDKFPTISKNIVILNRMPYENVVSALAEASVLLLFNYYSFMGTKIYDYLGLQRFILMCFSDDVEANKIKKEHYTIDNTSGLSDSLQADLISQTNSGITAKDKTHLISILNQLQIEFNLSGRINYSGKKTNNYSRKRQIMKLSKIIHQITK